MPDTHHQKLAFGKVIFQDVADVLGVAQIQSSIHLHRHRNSVSAGFGLPCRRMPAHQGAHLVKDVEGGGLEEQHGQDEG